MQHSVRQQVRNSLRHRTGVKPTIETKFLQKTYFARVLSCKPILQEEKCESKYDTKCETQYATEYEEVKKKHIFISSVFLTYSSSQGLSYRDKDRVQDRVRRQVSFDILLGKQMQSLYTGVKQSTRISARLNTRRFTMKFVKMPHRKPW